MVRRLFGLVLVLFCGLMLWGVGNGLLVILSRKAEREILPMEYAAMATLGLGSAYGFYAGCRALFATRRGTGASTAMRKVGTGLIVAGLLSVYTQSELRVAGPPIFLYVAAVAFAAGGTLLFVFRNRAESAKSLGEGVSDVDDRCSAE